MATEKRLKVNFTNERCIETKFIDSKSFCTKMYAQKHTKYLYFFTSPCSFSTTHLHDQDPALNVLFWILFLTKCSSKII